MNRQDVIDHLQIIRTWAAVGEDPIYQGIEPKCCEDVEKWIDEALELLKEQEAVVPQKHYNQKEDLIYACGKCHNDLKPNNRNAKFCWFCGKPVLWK